MRHSPRAALLLPLLAMLAATARAADAAPPGSPNVIVILADDLGWGSLGAYGGEKLKTPHIDGLAVGGRRFTNAYAPGSVCSPTRYALMTGRYYWRTNIKDGEVLPGNAPLHFDTHRLNLGSLCKSHGYATAAVGKWHLGLGMAKQTDFNQPLTPGPLQVGFDYFYGLAANVGNHPNAYIENETLIGRVPGQLVAIEGKAKDQKTTGVEPQRVEDQVMRKLTDKAVGWIEQNHQHPFFLYFAPNAIHEPVTPSANFKGTSPFGDYGDFIHELDWSVGQVLSTLDRLKLANNTLIIFTSDNGGVVNPNNPHSSEALKQGLRINANLRGGKHDEWEGGFREPFIVRWPGHVPPGTVCDDIVSNSDVLATLAGILHAPVPAAGAAEDSIDVGAAWLGTGKSPRQSIILQDARANYCVREGPWKMVERENPPAFEPRNKVAADRIANFRKRAAKHDELFNLADDPSETKDLSADHPDIVRHLREVLANARTSDHTRP